MYIENINSNSVLPKIMSSVKCSNVKRITPYVCEFTFHLYSGKTESNSVRSILNTDYRFSWWIQNALHEKQSICFCPWSKMSMIMHSVIM